ncbi:rhodanese-like domain-containing protein [Flavobacteriaceae bacterium LMO-SS05]|jgi:rhodanese-related sulfurtransferase
MKKSIFILGLVMFLVTMSCKNEVQEGVKLVTPAEMQDILELDDVQLVDVRTPDEYKDGHIENSQNIDYNSPTFDEDINKLDKTKPVILYCGSGKRSAKCSIKLIAAGFEKIYELEGGITEWKYKGLDIIVK